MQVASVTVRRPLWWQGTTHPVAPLCCQAPQACAGAQQHEDGDGHDRVLTATCHSPHLPTALKADPSWTLVAPGGHQSNTDQMMNAVKRIAQRPANAVMIHHKASEA